MTPARRSAATTPQASPPTSREELLAAVGHARAELYVLARRLLGELELAAPWEDLYHPTTERRRLLDVHGALCELLAGIPDRVAQLRGRLDREPEPAGHELADLDFYITGLHGLLGHDLARLEDGVRELEANENAPGVATILELSELAADLKGRYTAFLIGAVNHLLAAQRWSSPAVEAVLFPEKAEEAERSRTLLAALERLVERMRSLPAELDVTAVLNAWRRQRPVDPYALVPLVAVRGQLAALLAARCRRALYSGDYHQLRARERRLALRLGEIEALHAAIWDPEPPFALVNEVSAYPRLQQLLVEVLAILDVELLTRVIGAAAVERLRKVVTDELEDHRASGGQGETIRLSLPEDLQPLVPLLYDEDLRTFGELLFGSVAKRAALAPPAAAPPEREAAGAQGATAPSRQVREVEVRRLNHAVGQLLGKRNRHWNAFRMAQRLLSTRSRIPVEMLRATLPFVAQLDEELVPELEGLTTLGPLAADLVDRLRRDCALLARIEELGAEGGEQVAEAMERVEHLLEALRGAAESLLKVDGPAERRS